MEMKQTIDRLNELYKLSQSRPLNTKELEERDKLRKEYLAMIRGQVQNALENIEIVDGDAKHSRHGCGCGHEHCDHKH